MTKYCSNCNKVKNLDEFYANVATKDGREYRCIVCKSLYIRNKWKTDSKYRESHSLYYKGKAKYSSAELEEQCLSCNIEYKTKYAPNRSGYCPICAKKISDQRWTQNHLSLKAQNSAKRRSAKSKSIPKWLTNEHYEQMQRYYDAAQWVQSILGELIEVDHIVPLQGKEVKGFHVPWNLQLLTKKDNASKGSKYGQ